MTLISDANFLVVDVETTGSNPKIERITDIACLSVKNFEIIDTFSSLINPHRHIPSYIQKMTGITDKMVLSAPEAQKIMSQIRDIMLQNNSFFVAHNSFFDWGFVNETMSREKLFFNEIPSICTLKIARKIIPQNIKKNVGSLAEYFNIPIINRHRAYDDALATAIFFIEMLKILQEQYEITTVEEILEFQDKKQTRYSKIDLKTKNKLLAYRKIIPEQNSGILIFIGISGEILYITKSNNLTNFLDSLIEQNEILSSKMISILNKFKRIDWILTNSELENYILENRKIKFFEPKFNFYTKNLKDNNQLINLFSENISRTNEEVLSAKDLNLIALHPNSEREKTIDIYFINNGKFESLFTVGLKSNLDLIFEEIHKIFYEEKPEWEKEIDFDEIKLINNWLKKHENSLKLELFQNQSELTFCELIEQKVRTFYNKEEYKK